MLINCLLNINTISKAGSVKEICIGLYTDHPSAYTVNYFEYKIVLNLYFLFIYMLNCVNIEKNDFCWYLPNMET